MCQNNIDYVQYNGGFEIEFGFAFRCSEWIEECMNNELPHTYMNEYEYEYDLLFYSLHRTPLNGKPLPYVK